jgi:hypothetical protein
MTLEYLHLFTFALSGDVLLHECEPFIDSFDNVFALRDVTDSILRITSRLRAIGVKLESHRR